MPKKKQKPERQFSKHQLTRWEQQEKRHKMFLYGGIGVIIVALALIILALLNALYFPFQKTVLEINGTKFSMGHYVKILELYAEQQPDQLQALPSYAASIIEQNELIYQGASQLGVTVTDDEIKAELKDQGLSNDYWNMARASLLVDKLRTNEKFTAEVPQTAPQADVLAMFVESETLANQLRDEIMTDPDPDQKFKDLAAANSWDSYSQQNNGVLGYHPQEILDAETGSTVPGEYAFASEAGNLSQPRPEPDKTKNVGYWLVKVTERKTENDVDLAHAYVMLLGSQAEAEDIKARLAAGEDWETIAKESSQYQNASEDGGNLDFITKGLMPKAVDDAVFTKAEDGISYTLDINTVTDPLKDETRTTKGGFWLVKVVDKSADKELASTDYDYLMGQVLNAWLLSVQSNSVIVNNLESDPSLVQFAVDKVAKDLNL